jgi:hypothetical protein
MHLFFQHFETLGRYSSTVPYLMACLESYCVHRVHSEGQQSTESQQETEEVEDHQCGHLSTIMTDRWIDHLIDYTCKHMIQYNVLQ